MRKDRQVHKDNVALRAAYQTTYDVEECLLKLTGNLALREVSLSTVERELLRSAIAKLADTRSELSGIDPNRYLG
jgi:hypothetical protein